MVSTSLRNVLSPRHAHSTVRSLCSAKSKLGRIRFQLRTKVRGSIDSRKLSKRHHRDMARLSSAFMVLVGLLVMTLVQGKNMTLCAFCAHVLGDDTPFSAVWVAVQRRSSAEARTVGLPCERVDCWTDCACWQLRVQASWVGWGTSRTRTTRTRMLSGCWAEWTLRTRDRRECGRRQNRLQLVPQRWKLFLRR